MWEVTRVAAGNGPSSRCRAHLHGESVPGAAGADLQRERELRRGRNAKQRQQGNKERRTDLHLLGIVAKRPHTSVGLGSCPELTEKLELVGFFMLPITIASRVGR